jgi:hypothetical protein
MGDYIQFCGQWHEKGVYYERGRAGVSLDGSPAARIPFQEARTGGVWMVSPDFVVLISPHDPGVSGRLLIRLMSGHDEKGLACSMCYINSHRLMLCLCWFSFFRALASPISVRND